MFIVSANALFAGKLTGTIILIIEVNWYMMDTLIYIALLNITMSSFDGSAFLLYREYPGYDGQTIVCPERGPVALLTGPYPTWGSFALAGAAEVVVLTAVSYGLKRLHCRYWWVPQCGVSGIHFYLGIANIYTRKKFEKYGRKHGLM